MLMSVKCSRAFWSEIMPLSHEGFFLGGGGVGGGERGIVNLHNFLKAKINDCMNISGINSILQNLGNLSVHKSSRFLQYKVYSWGGTQLFFQVAVCGPDFWSVGLANWHLPLKGACKLKISKFGGLWAENFQIWVKIEAVEAKISKFSQKGVLWTDTFAWNGTLANYRRGVKGVLQGLTSPYPLSRSVASHPLPPPGFIAGSKISQIWCIVGLKRGQNLSHSASFLTSSKSTMHEICDFCYLQ